MNQIRRGLRDSTYIRLEPQPDALDTKFGVAVTKRPDIATNKLEVMVRERIEQGRLPVAVSVTVRAGYGGFGAKCAVCALEIESRHVEYEVIGVTDDHCCFISVVIAPGRRNA
jgi:hypothetical protein